MVAFGTILGKTNRGISAQNPNTGSNFSHNITTFNISLSYDLNGNIMTLDNKNAGGNATAASIAISFIQHEEGRFRPNGSEMPQETSPLAQAASPSKWTSHRPSKFFFSPSLWVGYGAMAESRFTGRKRE